MKAQYFIDNFKSNRLHFMAHRNNNNFQDRFTLWRWKNKKSNNITLHTIPFPFSLDCIENMDIGRMKIRIKYCNITIVSQETTTTK